VTIENESVARPLTGLTDEQIVQTGEVVKKLAEDEKKEITAAIVQKAAAQFRPAKRRKKGKSKAKKVVVGQIDLDPGLKLLAKVEKVAELNKDQAVLKELAGLREWLQGLAGG